MYFKLHRCIVTSLHSIGTVFGIVLLLSIFPLLASAETVVRTGDSVSIASSQIVENDLYVAGGSVTHSGQVREDLYVVAGTLTVNGLVGNDLTAFAGTAQIHAPVEDDVRVVGGDVVISEDVGGDVFVMGGMLKVLSSATVAGNVYFYGGEAEIEGVVSGAIMGRAESFTINSEVGGMDVLAVGIELGDRAIVRGDVHYSGVTELNRAPGAVVEGDMLRGASAAEKSQGGNAGLIFMLAWIFTTLVFFLLLRPHLSRLLDELKSEPLRIGLIGLISVFAAPILSVVLLVTVLGAWIGLVLLLTTILKFIFGIIIMPILVGGYLMSFVSKGRKLDLLSVVVGIVAIFILSQIPVVGPLVIAISFVLTIGAVMYAIYKSVRRE